MESRTMKLAMQKKKQKSAELSASLRRMKGKIVRVLAWFSALERPLTLEELWREGGISHGDFALFLGALQALEAERAIHVEGPYFSLAGAPLPLSSKRETQDKLREEKWQKLLRNKALFRFIPFLDFVLVAGSLALGNITENSDFDVIVGAQQGRIFTVRTFSLCIAALYGVRRKSVDGKLSSADKVCFNHFVTEKGYCLAPPYNCYWQMLYRSLVPFFGSEARIQAFSRANDWAGGEIRFDDRWQSMKKNALAYALEALLRGAFGDFLEKALKRIQIQRIKKRIAREEVVLRNERLRYDDTELEFHPDTARIDAIVAKSQELLNRLDPKNDS